MMRPKAFSLLLSLAAAPLAVAGDDFYSDDSRHVDVAPGQVCRIEIPAIDAGPRAQFVEAGVGLTSGKGAWRFVAVNLDGDTIALDVAFRERHFGDIDHARELELALSKGSAPVATVSVGKGVSMRERPNHVRLTSTPQCLTVAVGDRDLREVVRVEPVGFFKEAWVEAGEKKLEIVRRVSSVVADSSAKLLTGLTMPYLQSAVLSARDSRIGFWRLIDYDIESDMARLGGRYQLATIPADGDAIDIIYLGGAVAENANWRPMMRKGRMTPSGLPGNYNLQWVDAEFNGDITDANAAFVDNTLTLYFPLEKSTLRFVKIDAPSN